MFRGFQLSSLRTLFFCLLFAIAMGCSCEDETGGVDNLGEGDAQVGDDVDFDADATGGDNDGICTPAGDHCEDSSECCDDLFCNENDVCGDSEFCEADGESCSTDAVCCSGNCDGDVCAPGEGPCIADGNSCEASFECCSLSCVEGECTSEVECVPEGDDCSADDECCSNQCDGDTCAGGACLAPGEPCDTDPDNCCTACLENADGQLRCASSGSCQVSEAPCTENNQCCNGICDDGFCADIQGASYEDSTDVPSCRVVGEVCSQATDCCSFACWDDGRGYSTCQYLGGCRVRGELCNTDEDCCMIADGCQGTTAGTQQGFCQEFSDYPGHGRCDHEVGPGPRVAGEVCELEGVSDGLGHDCCGDCENTSLGIPRCYGEGVLEECIEDGQSCAFSDECCYGVCAPDDDGQLVCNPGPACYPEGHSCTDHDDCCEGFCNDEGYCGCIVDGGSCADDGDCCEGHCNDDGICGPDECIPKDESCTDHDDCCTGYCDPDTELCADVPALCLEDGEECTNDDECCSESCIDGICRTPCVVLGGSCTTHADCCDGHCSPDGICEEGDGAECGLQGDPCDTIDDCCETFYCHEDNFCQYLM